jgi:TPR repeat protein
MERALSWYRRAATQFYAPAQIALEALGQTGVGRRSATAKRKGAAAERRRDPAAWEASAANGDAACKYSYAVMCEQGWVVPHDEEAAQTWYLRSAKLGEPRAQHALAQILERQRDPQAMEWYRKAAEQGFVQAQTALGRLHAQRDQGGADALQSASWLLRAGLAQDRDALMALADALTRNPERLALACQQQAAALGEPYAQWALAQRYAQGLGVGPNPALALQWTQRAAQQGVPQAQCALGAFYIEGSAVPKDFGQAFHWFSQAAEQGDPKAQWNLGSLFASGGPGLKKDLRQAFAWCHKSADANFVPAQATLGVLYARIKDHERAAQCFKNAANDGDLEAQYNLGVLYSKGQGVEENQEQAFHWFARAAERGLVSAQARLALMLATGTGVAKDPLEAHKWLALAATGGDASAQANLHKSEDQLLKSQITEAKRRAEVWKSQNPVTQ